MKLLYIPHPGGIDKDLQAAFEKKFTTRTYTDIENAIDFKPEIVYIQSGSLPVSKLVKLRAETGCRIAQWAGDYRPEGLPEVKIYQPFCDFTFTADVGVYDFYTYFLAHPIAMWQFLPVHDKADGVIFIGHDYDHLPGAKERRQLVQMLKHRGDFTVYGSDNAPDVPYRDIPKVYNRHAYGIAANIYYDGPHWFGNRPLMIMAAGSCCLMREFPGWEHYFIDGTNCLIYRNNSEVEGIINDTADWYREEIAWAGQQLVLDNFTYTYFVGNFYDIISNYY